MTLEELYDRLGLKGDDRCGEGVIGQHTVNTNAIRLQKERADRAEAELRAVRVAGGQPLDDTVSESQWVTVYEVKREWASRELLKRLEEVKTKLAEAPWIDQSPNATEIHQGNPEGNPDGPNGWGVIGLTWRGVEQYVQKAKEDQREACALQGWKYDQNPNSVDASTALEAIRLTALVK